MSNEPLDSGWLNVAIAIAVVLVLLATFILGGCRPASATKDAVRGSQGPPLPSHDKPSECVGDECGVPSPGR